MVMFNKWLLMSVWVFLSVKNSKPRNTKVLGNNMEFRYIPRSLEVFFQSFEMKNNFNKQLSPYCVYEFVYIGAKATSLQDEFIANPIYCSNCAAIKIKERNSLLR